MITFDRVQNTLVIFFCLIGLCPLAVHAFSVPGCTGPLSPAPCDFIGLARTAAETAHPFTPHSGLEAVDRGSSAYVHQPDRSHGAGVLIDRRSCRVCQVDRYSTAIPDFLLEPGDSNGRMLAYAPPELSSEQGPPDILWELNQLGAEMNGFPLPVASVRDAQGRTIPPAPTP